MNTRNLHSNSHLTAAPRRLHRSRASVPGSLLLVASSAVAWVGCGGGGGTVGHLSEAQVPSPTIAPRISQVALPAHIVGAAGSDQNARLGRCVATGDFNGDGRADVAAGMPGAAGGRGAVAVVYGTAAGMDLSNPDLSTHTRLTAGALTGFTDAVGDQVGSAVATGDFDGDGLADLAIGAPYRLSGGSAGAGQVFVVYGSRERGAAGLVRRLQTITQVGAGVEEAQDHFGAALAAGDFNGDGYQDLAIGAPEEDLDGRADAGAVFIRYGSARGLTGLGYHVITAATRSVATGANATEAGEHFGACLAAGRLHTLPYGAVDDLVVGAPGKDVSIYSASAGFRNVTFADAGRIYVHEGLLGMRELRHRVDIIADTWPEGVTGFGSALAIGDFDGNGRNDLAAGAPEARMNGTAAAGGLFVMMYNAVNGSVGGRAFPDVRNTQYQRKADRVLDEAPIARLENGDRYGFALAAADFNRDGRTDLAVGAPWEDWAQANDTGLVFVFLGTGGGLDASFGCQYFFLDQAPRGANEAGDRFGYALAAGDVTGDGQPDLVVGAPYEDHSGVVDGGALFLARTSLQIGGAFDGVWAGTLEGDNGTTATLRLYLCDRDGVVAGSGFLDDTLERNVCGETVSLGREADVLAGTRLSERSATGQLLNFELPDDVRADVGVDLVAAADGNSLTGTIRIRNVRVDVDVLGWVDADALPGCNSDIDLEVTLWREP